MKSNENNILFKIAAGVTTLMVVGAVGALLVLWRAAHGEAEHSRQIAIEVPALLEPLKVDVQEIRIEQAEQRVILDRIDQKLDP